MKRPLLTMLAAGALALTALTGFAATASADPGYGRDSNYRDSGYRDSGYRDGRDLRPTAFGPGASFQSRLDRLSERIDWAASSGRISWREARGLRRDLFQIARLRDAYRRDGVSPSEARDLDLRLDRLSQQIRFERNDRDGYSYRDPRDRGW